MLTDESNATPAHSLDLASASGVIVRSFTDEQPLAANSSWRVKRRRHCLFPLEEEELRPRKFFRGRHSSSRIGHRHVIALNPSSNAIADAILHDQISLRLPSPACMDVSRDVRSAPVVHSCGPRLTALPFSAPECSLVCCRQ